MSIDIDSLQIEIEATSSDAAQKIDQLANSLSNLKSVAKGGAGLTAVTNQLNKLKNALSVYEFCLLKCENMYSYCDYIYYSHY